jgi:type I restriction enzyme S subunit
LNTKQLRQKILDLTIHGKFVPQDPNDKPASILLEKIRIEKQRLVKEKKIKPNKQESGADKPSYRNVPFEAPKGWAWCRK